MSSDPSPPARLLRARDSYSTARWAGAAVKACVVTWAIVPRPSANEMYFSSLPTRTFAGRPESRCCLAKRKYTVAVEAVWPPVVSSAKGEKRDPVAAQVVVLAVFDLPPPRAWQW